MKPAVMDYVAAVDSEEVLAALADGEAAVLAGGQSLVLDVTHQELRPRRIVEVRLPMLPAGTGAGFAEHRPAFMKFADAAAMAAVTVEDGLITRAAVGLVNAGPCPVRARAAEQVLIGAELSDAVITAAAEAGADLDARLDQQPEVDPRSRRRAFKVLTRRALTQARENL